MENALIAQCLAGNHAAFEEIITAHQTQVFSTALSLLHNPHDAEDAAQEVFLKLYKSLPRFRGHSSLSTWLYRVTVNTCYDISRKRKPTAPLEEAASADSYSMEEDMELRERKEALYRAIGQLKFDLRTVITLREVEGLSYEEIAKVVRLPLGTVKSRVSRARNQLQKIISKQTELF